MCGIAGFVTEKLPNQEKVLEKMIGTLSHRGPDDKGAELFIHNGCTIALGQVRLSIIDLSEAGHQPMHFGPYSIVFNGEIYNYVEIRTKLQKLGHSFVSQSDTEVILHAYDEWGQACVEYMIGMFAFVIYDRRSDMLWACRDRAGVKPFYYYFFEGTFVFASELKAFHSFPLFKKEIDTAALALYFHYGYIPAPHSIFSHTYKLMPGHSLIYSIDNKTCQVKPYWQVTDFYRMPKLSIDYSEAKQAVKDILLSACSYRMVADVPVGVFLSGGYDSTAVTAILQHNRAERLKTFTIGFREGNNEAPYARATADYLGTDHTEYLCTSKEAQEIIPTLPYYYDEPFADSSAIPTMLVSRIARQSVTVALSADAGDEVFAGYDSYSSLHKKLQLLDLIPNGLKIPVSNLAKGFEKWVPTRYPAFKHKLFGVAEAMHPDTFTQAAVLFRLMNSLPNSYFSRLFTDRVTPHATPSEMDVVGFHDPIDIALAIDYQMYLQNDILTKVDRATMSVSLEGREPLLDHRIIEFVARLPLSFKFDGKTQKKILKDIVHEYVPKSMMDRPKAGFSLPIYSWLKGDLRYLIDEFLCEDSLKESGLFRVDFLKKQVDLFVSDQLHYKPFIWKLLMFQMWYKKWMTNY
ncbi:MAG: asparagine synthase (glutamine-hydrolyzing) [Thermaurantimonas sp.]